MDKIVQIKYARGLQYAKNKICLILGVDEEETVILARSSSLSWKISKDLISHLVKCNFTSKESKKLNSILMNLKLCKKNILLVRDLLDCFNRIKTIICYF